MLRTMPHHDVTTADEESLAGIGNEARLVDAARRGNRNAFGELVLRYERRLIRLIGQFVTDVDQAEDLAQETFVRAYQRLDQFDPARRFGPWLFRIGVNLTLDFLRKRKRRGWWALFTDASAEQTPDPAVVDPPVAGSPPRPRTDPGDLPSRARTARSGEFLHFGNRSDSESERSDDPLATRGSPQPVSTVVDEACQRSHHGARSLDNH
jgi:RNA polymerase sigma factor (sigma-70 family)